METELAPRLPTGSRASDPRVQRRGSQAGDPRVQLRGSQAGDPRIQRCGSQAESVEAGCETRDAARVMRWER